MKAFVFICVVFTSVFTYSETCTCPGAHPQEHFCNADFVIRATILRRVETGSSQFEDVYYSVRITRYYKGGPRIGLRTQRIYTARYGASCGVSFQIGREYIIAGSIQNNKWRASLCRWNPRTSSLTQFQRNALRYGYYRDNCRCEIRDCTTTNRSQCSVSPWNECLIRKNIYCFRRHNACISSGRRCYWQSQACSSIGMDGLASRRSFTTSSLK